MKTKVTFQLIKEFSNLYKNGHPLRAVAKKYSVSPNTVKKYLQNNGVMVRCKNIVYDLKKNDELLIGLYIGIWAGDGTQFLDKGYKIKICCDRRNKDLTQYFQKIICNLFDKQTRIVLEKTDNRSYIVFKSKFIYSFVYKFLDFNEDKTYSVCLNNSLSTYSDQFINGFFLGLMLTDGYLKTKFYFNSISIGLAQNVSDILKKFDMSPEVYVHNREKYGWRDLNMVRLNRKESSKALCLLDRIIEETGDRRSFSALKGYGKNGPAEI